MSGNKKLFKVNVAEIWNNLTFNLRIKIYRVKTFKYKFKDKFLNNVKKKELKMFGLLIGCLKNFTKLNTWYNGISHK